MTKYEDLIDSFRKYSNLEQYQDIIVDGTVVSSGVKSCEQRMNAVRMVASTWKRPITILDIGANLGFFTINLAKEFNCTVVAIEGVYGDWIKEVLEANGLANVLLLNKVFTLDDLRTLAEVEHFDLVLAMSVIHHFDGEYEEILSVINSLGDISLIELATEDLACGQKVVEESYVPSEAKLIGYYDSHIENMKRPMFLLQGSRNTLEKSYIDTPLDDIQLIIDSSFLYKKAIKGNQFYDWHRGINLKTWLNMGGSYPSRDWVFNLILNAKPIENHGDLYTHNIILQGDGVKFIDSKDPRREVYDDNITMLKVIQDLGY